jgi:hypothetical protein
MIDKIEAMIGRDVKLRGMLSEIMESALELRDDPYCSTVRQSKFYEAVADLRPLGFDAMLHYQQKRYGTHKVELFETGKKGMAEIQDTVERIVDCDPDELRLGRIDLAADVRDVSLSWFREHTYVQFKQFVCAHAKVVEDEETEMGKKVYQTLYFGKKPSCVRIYDKVAERVAQFELMKRKANRRAKKEYADYLEALKGGERDLFQWPQFPAVEEWLDAELPQMKPALGANLQIDLLPGTSPPVQPVLNFPVVTRVENQFGGRVPANLHTLGEMRKNVLEFNPFERMKLMQGNQIPPGFFDKVPCPWGGEKYRFRVLEWMAYMYVRDNWQTLGAGQMWSMLNRDRHGKLYLEKMEDFLPVADSSPGISEPDLYDCYRNSISRQLAA